MVFRFRNVTKKLSFHDFSENYFARGITCFWRKISRRAILNFLLKKLPGETLCKFFQIFPPKDLVYIGKIFSSRLFN